jgi:hypothetical protein
MGLRIALRLSAKCGRAQGYDRCDGTDARMVLPSPRIPNRIAIAGSANHGASRILALSW